MGLYNTIKDFKIQCPNCHEWVHGFQTKDRQDMEESEVCEVDNFYSGCDNCGAWIEFTRTKASMQGMTPTEHAAKYFTVAVTKNQFPTREL